MSDEVYTEEMHIKGLLLLLKLKDPCTYCPGKLITAAKSATERVIRCKICMSFVGIKKKKIGCPCYILGNETAIKRTIKGLKKRGYSIQMRR